MHDHLAEQAFDKVLALKYQLCNGLFLRLPFPSLKETAINLPVFAEHCCASLEKGLDPLQIVDDFFLDISEMLSFEKRWEHSFSLFS